MEAGYGGMLHAYHEIHPPIFKKWRADLYAFSILTDVIVSEPATALSLNKLIFSFSSFKAKVYNNGK